MGVEYQHWIVVEDPSFIPSPDAAGRVHEVLTEWGLGGALELYDLGSGGAALRGTLDGPPANALLVYRDSVEGEALEAIGAEVLDDSGDTAAGAMSRGVWPCSPRSSMSSDRAKRSTSR